MPAGNRGRTERTDLSGLGAVLADTTWRKLTALGSPRTYKPGYVLMDQGEQGRHVVVLLKGRVKISRFDEDGYQLVLATRGAGEVVGELGVLARERRSAEVRASATCEVRIIPDEVFNRFVKDEKLDALISQHISRRLLEDEHLRHLTRTRPVELRVARGLLHFAKLALGVAPDQDVVAHDDKVDIWLNQSDLSMALDMARPTLTSKITELRDAGIVETQRGRVTVLDLGALVARCRRRPL